LNSRKFCNIIKKCEKTKHYPSLFRRKKEKKNQGLLGFPTFLLFSGKIMKDKKNNQSIQPDESDGEKVSGKPTLVRKGIRTYYGIVEDSFDNKKENYDEVCHAEDRRIVNAAIALRSRLSSKEREEAQEWHRNFSALVGEWMC
jgi:hypothetical protein